MKRQGMSGQRGIALIMVLAFLAVAAPVITGALALSSNLSLDSGVKERILKRQYALLGASQDAIYRLAYQPGYLESLQTGVPTSYSITLNGEALTVTVTSIVAPLSSPPPPPMADNARRLQAYKFVTPTVASPGVLTTFTYSVIVRNQDDDQEQVTHINDHLPPGFSYVAGSSSGVTTNNPNVNDHHDGDGESYQELDWNLSSLHIVLQPGEQVALEFQTQATLMQGNYCNEAWAEPGAEKTSSGLTARITVGSPLNGLCPGEAMRLTKTVDPATAAGGVLTTFTYTIAMKNTGTEELYVSKLVDLLPVDFTYVSGSTSGDVAQSDPSTMVQQGSQQLTWNLNPDVLVAPGATKTLTFRATGTLAPGDYWNQVWASVDELQHPVYTWPTAMVHVMGVAKSSVTGGKGIAYTELWVAPSEYVVTNWSMTP